MKEIIQMIVVLSVISTICGLALSGVRNMTAERIENQVLMNVQGPKVKLVLDGADNDLIADRKKIKINEEEILLFIGKKKDKLWAIAYESIGGGFGGDLKVMVGYDLHKNKMTGVQIIEHKETPGVGSKVTEDQFTKMFKGVDLDINFATKNDGGDIDGITGATYSSRGVSEAIQKSIALLPEIKKLIQKQ
jgi:electron transport complex protein RnfG